MEPGQEDDPNSGGPQGGPPGAHVRKLSLYESLADSLKDEIRGQRVPTGAVLLEGPLAELFGTSRAPVRQALRILADEGLISRFDGRGFVVGPSGTAPIRANLAEILVDLAAQQEERPSFAWQTIYEEVESQVVYRSFFGRLRVNELELARHYGVGRTVARDVMLRLETLGLIEKDDASRWSIVPLDNRRLSDLYEVREHLEPLALGGALERLSDAEIGAMLDRHLEALAQYPNVTAATMYDLELDLHVRCVQRSPNQELVKILQRTHCVLTLSKHTVGIRVAMPDHEPFMGEHISAFRTMLRRDREGLQLVMRSHIHGSLAKVMERAETVRHGPPPARLSYFT
ncbi:GntR family transcriptional regulator [Paenirhodobacter populi]|uniref:GntR family transcriptional regulator n=1 Tax=Paenirhodobacter populi TaxID=2306993 RepID=A0A443K6J5_9RHOB|nr:GntR family transcriptional regulator [Sinirhodobacter populi]RWR05342.1 GntR family transcriptional regulator [Sinirhodobacter populi]RWR18098.1 GntR family transcriptional regulator [Sinirhodobacter populi]RWR28366.1 GntR family transcriptional regulator [Sinirhodobacter populi]